MLYSAGIHADGRRLVV
nr:hypothetical protein [Escherichia albertii]